VLTLIAGFTESWPAGGYTIKSGTSVTVTVISPFASTWQSYIESLGITTVTCYLWGSPAKPCPTTFSVNGPLGKVVATMSLTSLTLQVGEFSLRVV